MKKGSRKRRSLAAHQSCTPVWRTFLRYLWRWSIQDGLPVLAEVSKEKVKFTQIARLTYALMGRCAGETAFLDNRMTKVLPSPDALLTQRCQACGVLVKGFC